MYIFTQTFKTQVHQRITVTDIFPLYPDKPVLSYLLSLFLTSEVLTDTNIQSQETCLILFWSSERQAATKMK